MPPNYTTSIFFLLCVLTNSSFENKYFRTYKLALKQPHILELSNVTVSVGETAILTCTVKHLANHTVLWLRHRDTTLLAAGPETHTTDPRIRSSIHNTTLFRLQITDTKLSDSGAYECQVPVNPVISAVMFLNILAPATKLLGLTSPELFLHAGSTLNLTCLYDDPTRPAPSRIIWNFNGKTLTRGGVSLTTERSSEYTTVSKLLVKNTDKYDSGTYNCVPRTGPHAHVLVIVLQNGENQAAVQSGATTFHYRMHILAIIPIMQSLMTSLRQNY